MIKTTLKIDGMMCGMCEAHVKYQAHIQKQNHHSFQRQKRT